MKDRGTSRRYSEDNKRGDVFETPPKELFDAHELAGQIYFQALDYLIGFIPYLVFNGIKIGVDG